MSLFPALQPTMTQARKDIVKKAFEKFDKTGDGKVTVADVKGIYSVKYSPDFQSGKKTEDELLTEFLNSFEPDEASRDGVVRAFMRSVPGLPQSVAANIDPRCHYFKDPTSSKILIETV